MYSLIIDLWASQNISQFKTPINIPLTIIIQPKFKINWFFTKENKILKKKTQNCQIRTIIEYLKEHNIQMNIITSQQPYLITACGQIQLHNDQISHEQIEVLLTHLEQFPNTIINPIILQEQFYFGQYISLTWNKNYTFIQECNKFTYISDNQCLKMTPHYRQQVDSLSQELVQRIQGINQHRGNLQQMKIILVLLEKPIFYWCAEIKFLQDQIVLDQEQDTNIWMKVKELKLTFSQKTINLQHKRCLSNIDIGDTNSQQITQTNRIKQKKLNYINENYTIQINNLSSHRIHNVSTTSNASIQKVPPLFQQLKSNRNTNSNLLNVKSLLLSKNNQSTEISTQRQTRGSVLKQLSSRSFSNRSTSMCKVYLHDEKVNQQKNNGSCTQRTEPSESDHRDITLSLRITRKSKVLNNLRQKLQEIKLKELNIY